MNRLILIILLCAQALCAQTAFAQRFIPNPEDKARAEKLSAQYKDESFVAMRSEVNHDFEIAKDKTTVVATQAFTESFFAVKDNASFSKRIFYNDQSTIEKVRGYSGATEKYAYLYPSYTDYQSEGIFYDDAQICSFGISLPALTSRFKYEAIKEYKDIKYLTSIYFHDLYPIAERVITFNVPDAIQIELKEINFEHYNVTKTSKKVSNITTYTYTLKDIPAYKSESYAPRFAKDYPHILVLCKSFETDGKTVTLLSSADDLYKWYNKLCKEVDNQTTDIKPVVTELVAGKTSDIEKIESIYYWVQNNIRYIAFEDGLAGFKPEAAQNVYNKKYGDCKGMANLTKVMLKVAGYDARLTWIGTNGIPYDYSIPSLAVDNHMICTVVLEGKRYFLDPTEDYISFNDYAHRIQGRPVMIEDGEKYIIDKIPEFTKDRNKVHGEFTLALQGENLIGNCNLTINGEEKTRVLRAYSDTKSDDKEAALKNYLSSGEKNFKLTNIIHSDLEDRQKALNISYDLTVENYVTSVGNEIYVNIDTEKEYGEYKIKEERVNDIEFPNKVFIETTVEFVPPANYKVDYLPEPVRVENEDFSFDLSMATSGNKIIYNKKISIDNALIRKKDFKMWNEYIEKVNKFYNDQIVLIKP